jgi:DmsE family decaheme c-type cytochrome
MRLHRFLLPTLCAVALLTFAGRAWAAPQPPESTPPQGYAGSDVCMACHGEVADHLANTPHGSKAFERLAAHGCESCHGPAAAHAENPDDPALRPSITKLSAKDQAKICQSCHSGRQQMFWHGSVHANRGLSCQSCHSIHSFKSDNAQLKTANEIDVCLSCHKDVRADLWKNSHHPVREGKIACADCHNPHGSTTPKMIRAASVNDLCYSCHADKRGPFLWEHAPVRESCLNCHVSHGSNHIKLQKTSVPYLCQQCHANTRHPGTLYDGTTLADQSRASNRIFNRGCTDCHASVHGSNHPSSPYLGH